MKEAAEWAKDDMFRNLKYRPETIASFLREVQADAAMTNEKADQIARETAQKLWDWCGYAWPEANKEGFMDKAAEIVRAQLTTKP